VDTLKAGLNSVPSCETTKSMASSITSIPALPLPDLDVAGMNAEMDTYGGYISMGGLGVGMFLLLCACLYSAITLAIKLKLLTGARKTANTFVNFCCAPCTILLLGLFWIIGGVLAILGVVFADLCIVDPIAKVVGLLAAALGPGDATDMLNYLIMCKGAAPAMLMSMVDIQIGLNEMVSSMAGLSAMFSSIPGCEGVNPAAITTGFEDVVTQANNLIGLASCSVFNPIFAKVLNLAICTDLQASFMSTATGLAVLGMCVMLSMFNFAKVDRHESFLERKINPVDGGTEMASRSSVSRSESLPLAKPVPTKQ